MASANRWNRTAGSQSARSIAVIVILDIAAPLEAYGLLRSAGMTAVTPKRIADQRPLR